MPLPTAMTSPTSSARNQTPGLWLGALGVLCFALALPATRLAMGAQGAPALSPCFVAFGSAALAGLLSTLFLLATRSPLPRRAHFKPLALAALGHVAGGLLLSAGALRGVGVNPAAAVTGLLPLATAVAAAWVLRQRAWLEFWLCAVLGGVLAVVFSLLRAHGGGAGGFGFAWADLLLAGAVPACAVGYVYGARVTPLLGAGRVICWACVLALPLTLPGALLLWPERAVPLAAWSGLACFGAVSLWAGFFAWYRALALGGALCVSQLQLLQPFVALLAAAWLLDEVVEPLSLLFAVAVIVTVVAGGKLAR